jgi:hypothetical protein
VWIGIGSLVSGVTKIMEYVFVGTRTWRSSSQDEEVRGGSSRWAEWGCESAVWWFGTVSLSRRVSSAIMKSLSEKCWLHTYCLHSFLACCALQGMPSVSAHSIGLCKNETRNETLILMVSVLCYFFTAKCTTFFTQTNHGVLCCLQHIGQILISSQSNIRWLVKHWRWTHLSSS